MADDLDPADWLASQFGEEEPEKRGRRRGMPAAERPAAPEPEAPPQAAPPAEPTAPYYPATAYTPPAAPPAATPPGSAGGGFSWGLTPGAAMPEPAVPAQPAASAAPVEPPAPAAPVEPPATAAPVEPPATAAAPDPFAALFQPAPLVEPVAPVQPAAPVEPVAAAWDTPTVATPAVPDQSASPAWDTPTVATPVARDQPAPTVAFGGAELARQEFPGFGVPVDRAIEGVTEVFGAQPVGLGAPEDEGIEVTALDSLFGESKFVEYQDALIPVLPPRASGGELVVVDRPRATEGRAPIPRVQKILMSVAGGLVAVLLLIVLFLAGQRIAANNPAPAVVADPTPSASAAPLVGPIPPGEYYWDRLLGGECLAPFTSPWEDSFTVVPCTQPHPAQLVLKGTFPAIEETAYPGVDALQKLAASLCTGPAVIDYAAAAGASDIQVLASFAADEQDWLGGNRTFYCFANRTGGAEFTVSIAKPQPLPTPAATETPTP